MATSLDSLQSEHEPMDATDVCIRQIAQDDLPVLYEYQLDAEANQMAFTHPRNADDFDAPQMNAVRRNCGTSCVETLTTTR